MSTRIPSTPQNSLVQTSLFLSSELVKCKFAAELRSAAPRVQGLENRRPLRWWGLRGTGLCPEKGYHHCMSPPCTQGLGHWIQRQFASAESEKESALSCSACAKCQTQQQRSAVSTLPYWKHHLVYQRGSDNVSEGWAALAQSLIRSSLTSAP